jgi:hypothetical protein
MHNLNAQSVAHRARFGRGLSLMASSVIALAVAPNVLAGFEYGIVTVNASASQLTGAGYTQVGTTFISQRAGDCFVNGCFTLAGASGVLPTRGFIAFQFEDFVNSPTYYNGMFSILDIDYGSTGLNRDAFIALINAQTSFTGVTAMTTGQANNAQGTCSFSEWLSPSLANSVVVNWQPDPAPATALGLSQEFVIGWDLDSALPPLLTGSGLGLNGVYAVPAPSALAILALGGLVGRRRR